MGNTESRETTAASASTTSDAPSRQTHRHSISGEMAVPSPEITSTTSTSRRHSISAPSSRASSGTLRHTVNGNTPTPSTPPPPPAPSSTVEGGGIERGQAATEEATGQLGYWYLLKNGYTELVNLIIRPPRAAYDMEELGPTKFTFANREYVRVDFVVQNDRQMNLQCSHWKPLETSTMDALPCVIYLHGNSSCRLEALSVLRTCLASGVTVVAFDCGGCGKSDGEYISLGYYERDDLHAVIDYLRTHANVSTIGLWGRSMGAATALLHADRDPTIAGIVVDSAFTNLEQLVQEIVERGRREGYTIPGFVVKIVMKFIRNSVQKRANFDIKSLSPIDHASISFVPALFVAANGDDFIAPHHSDQIYAQYAGDKNIVKVRGDHNSVRPQFLLDSAGIFLQTALHVDPRLCPDAGAVAMTRGARTPWTSGRSLSTRLMMMDIEAALHAGPHAVPKTEWACATCTFVNPPMVMQCEMCQTTYKPAESALLAACAKPTLAIRSTSSEPSFAPPRPSPPSHLVQSRLSDDLDDDESVITSSRISHDAGPPSSARTI